MWEDERDGPDEVFAMSREVVAVSGDVGVGRVEVAYGEPVRQHYRDLWVVRFDAAGRAVHFEEWPFWPDHGVTPQRSDQVVLDAAAVDAAPWREVVRSGSLSAGVYALAAGALDGQRPHAQDEVYVVVEGAAELEVEGRRHRMRAGSVAFVPARAEHRFVDITEDLRSAVVFAPRRRRRVIRVTASCRGPFPSGVSWWSSGRVRSARLGGSLRRLLALPGATDLLPLGLVATGGVAVGPAAGPAAGGFLTRFFAACCPASRRPASPAAGSPVWQLHQRRGEGPT